MFRRLTPKNGTSLTTTKAVRTPGQEKGRRAHPSRSGSPHFGSVHARRQELSPLRGPRVSSPSQFQYRGCDSRGERAKLDLPKGSGSVKRASVAGAPSVVTPNASGSVSSMSLLRHRRASLKAAMAIRNISCPPCSMRGPASSIASRPRPEVSG